MKFLTLENIQVDCRGLTEEQINEMLSVVDDKLDPLNTSFDLDKECIYFSFNKYCKLFGFYGIDEEQYVITYDRFMELFGDQIPDVGKMVKTFKVTEYSTGDFMDLGKDAGIIKAKNKDHAWELYKETHRLKDNEKGFYSFTETAEKPKEFQNLVESLNEELTEEAYKEKPQHYSKGVDTFARMEANCTTEECLAFAKGNIDKYNWREKGQDLEDYKKIIAYANWAIKLLEK